MNPCGDCTACCDSLGFTHDNEYTRNDPDIIASLPVARQEGIVYEWGSGCNKLCPNTGDCIIYERRPHVCSSFNCAYLKHDLELRDRPDRSGFITEVMDGWILITPILHGQRDVDIDIWEVLNRKRIKETVESVSYETGIQYDRYMLQSVKQSFWCAL